MSEPITIGQEENKYKFIDRLRLKQVTKGEVLFFDGIYSDAVEAFYLQLQCVKADTIKILLKSGGGEVYAALAMYDMIKREPKEVDIIVYGEAASAASMIVLQAARKRIATKHARFMLHEVGHWAFGQQSTSAVQDQAKEMSSLQDVVIDILAKRSKKTKAEVNKTFERKNKWMSAKEALEWGLIDAIE